jgi:hypothetical protein
MIRDQNTPSMSSGSYSPLADWKFNLELGPGEISRGSITLVEKSTAFNSEAYEIEKTGELGL